MKAFLRRFLRSYEADRSFDPWLYRFVLGSVLLAIVAIALHLVLMIPSYSGNLIPYAGTPIGLAFLFILAFILWRGPHTFRFALLVLYVVLTLRITSQLIYVVLAKEPRLEFQFLWVVGWMSMNYVLPFLIFRRRVAILTVVTTFFVWLLLSGVYVLVHVGNEEMRSMLIVLSQTYVADAMLILFMTVFARIRGLYFLSRESEQRMEKMAHTDFLLGIPNRRFVQAELGREVRDRDKPGTGSALTVVLIDIDHFKYINDTYGHDVGDEVLIEITSVIARFLNPLYYFGRWGGEEFLVVLPGCDGNAAYQLVQRIRGFMEKHKFSAFAGTQVTASFGVSQWRDGDDLDLLLKKADNALYKAKKLGRNHVELAD